MSNIIKRIIKFLLVVLIIFLFIYSISKVYIYNILDKSYNAYLENNRKENIHLSVNGVEYEDGRINYKSKSNIYTLGKYRKINREYEYNQTNTKHIMNTYLDLETYDVIDELIFEVDGVENKSYTIFDGDSRVGGENDSCPQIINIVEYFKDDEILLKEKIEVYFKMFNKVKIDRNNNEDDGNIILKTALDNEVEYKIWIDKKSNLVTKIEENVIFENRTDDGIEKIESTHIMEKQYFYDIVKEDDIKWPDLNNKVIKIQ